MPTILVTNAGRGSAVSIIRSLGRRGHRVIAADSDPRSAGLQSRYTGEALIYPPPERAPREFVAAVLRAVREKGIDLIIPVTDEVILPLSEARAQFAGLCQLAMPDPAGLEIVTNKQKTLELAERLGVPIPKQVRVKTAAEALEASRTFNWPIVLKPQASKMARGQGAIQVFEVTYADNLSHLASLMQGFEGRCPVLLQEYCRGVGYGVELLLHEGLPLAAFQHKRLREVPVTGGASAFRESVPVDPKLYDYSARILRELKWTGLAMVEFKGTPAMAWLMEINGRVWGSLPLAIHSGVDFPAWLADLYLTGRQAPPPVKGPNYRLGVRSRDLERELIWITNVLFQRRRHRTLPFPSRRQAVIALLQLFHPGYKYDVLSVSDPRPGLAEIRKVIAKFASQAAVGCAGVSGVGCAGVELRHIRRPPRASRPAPRFTDRGGPAS